MARNFDGFHTSALVAGDTFEPLAERVTKLISHDRRMVVIRRYMHHDQLTIDPGLKLDPEHRSAIEVQTLTYPEPSKQFWATLAPGIHGFGFSASDASTERQLRHKWDARAKDYGHDVTEVRLTGRGNEAGRDDRIEIERWNENRVGQLTIVIFQCDWDY